MFKKVKTRLFNRYLFSIFCVVAIAVILVTLLIFTIYANLQVSSARTYSVHQLEQVCQMVDTFMERGFTYFDTAYMYHKYESERVVKRALTERWPRERYVLADKLPLSHLKEEADMERFFREQLEKCGVAYFDYYMLHNMSRSYYKTAERLGAFEFVCRKKEGGKGPQNRVLLPCGC